MNLIFVKHLHTCLSDSLLMAWAMHPFPPWPWSECIFALFYFYGILHLGFGLKMIPMSLLMLILGRQLVVGYFMILMQLNYLDFSRPIDFPNLIVLFWKILSFRLYFRGVRFYDPPPLFNDFFIYFSRGEVWVVFYYSFFFSGWFEN